MAKVLSRLDILLFANTAQYRREMRETGESTRTLTQAMGNDVKEMAKVGAAAFASMAVAGTAAVGVLVQEQIELASSLSDAADVAGVSEQQIQKLSIASKQAGVDAEGLADMYATVTESVGDFLTSGGGPMADFFETVAPRIGLTAEAFRELSGPDALQLYYDSIEQANLSQSEMIFFLKSLGDEAAALQPLLQNNGEGFRVWAEAAENAGAVMDEETIRATKELQAATDLMTLSWDGAKNQFTRAIIPVLSDVAGELVGNGNAADTARIAGEKLAEGFKVIAKVGVGTVAVVKSMTMAIEGAVEVTAALVKDVSFSDNPVLMAFQMAKNYQTAKDINRYYQNSIDYELNNSRLTIDRIDSLGERGTNKTVASFVELNEVIDANNGRLAQTGQQYLENEKAAEAAAKSAKKQAEAQARLVGISGNTGIGSGAHIDIRYGSADARRHQKPKLEHINRFEVEGTPLGQLRKTSDFNMHRKHPVSGKVKPHYGVDYAAAIGSKITTTVPIKDVRPWFDKKGGGWVTTVTFEDGVQMNILHQSPAAKNIKGGPSGGKYKGAYNQANSLMSQSQKEAESQAKEIARIAEAQAKQRVAIRYEYADKIAQAEMDLAAKIKQINESNFGEDEKEQLIAKAKERSDIEVAQYRQSQSEKIASLTSFHATEQQLIEQSAQQRIDAIKLDTSLTKVQQRDVIENIEAERDYKLSQLQLTHDVQMQQAQSFMQTQSERINQQYELERRQIVLTKGLDEDLRAAKIESIEAERDYQLNQLQLTYDKEMQQARSIGQTQAERIRNQYELERRQIQLSVNMDEELRTAKIENINQAEQAALTELRLSHESELQKIMAYGQTQLQTIRAGFAEQRRVVDNRTDIGDAQKSKLRNAIAGSEIHAVKEYQGGVQTQYDGLQAEMNGTTANLQLEQQYQSRLEIIKTAKDAELLTVKEFESAKLQAEQQYQASRNVMMLSTLETGFANAAGLMKMAFGEQSKMYKAAFFAQKTFAVAQALIAIPTAYSKAFNAVVGIPFVGPVLAPAAGVAAAAIQVAQAAMIKNTQAPSAPGFMTGGYTGNIPTHHVAGEVHGREFVAHAQATRRYRPELEAMNDGTFERDNKSNVNITIENHTGAPVQQKTDSNGDIRMIVGQELERQLPAHVNNQHSNFNKSLRNNYQLKRSVG